MPKKQGQQTQVLWKDNCAQDFNEGMEIYSHELNNQISIFQRIDDERCVQFNPNYNKLIYKVRLLPIIH